ncbi:N-acetylneuraminate synthase family protein [Candidatus Giovannonibacteria bacterium]|nr:N-acetylneuraminate synthase family protein [Candidatus Giovannonibacteria bacterium]
MANEIKFGKITIGEGQPAAIIAEGCDNHGGSLSKAKEMAQAAKESGADIIKFQLHIPEEEMVKSEIEKVAAYGIFKKWGSLYGFVEKYQLKPEEHKELMNYCEKIGIQYLCTPFSLRAAELLNEMGAVGYKIGSGETEDLPMIEEVAKMGKPMMISTGMTTLDELDKAVSSVKYLNSNLCLAHCISTYPIKALSILKFGTIPHYKKRYEVPIGWSDHSAPEGIYDEELGRQIPEAEILAVALGSGAAFIEKHFTLDRSTDDADSFFSHDPVTLKNLVKNVRHWEAALKVRNEVLKEEEPVRLWAKRSLVAVSDIPAGAGLERKMFTSKRPGTGIRSFEYKSYLGKKTLRDIKRGEIIRADDLEK